MQHDATMHGFKIQFSVLLRLEKIVSRRMPRCCRIDSLMVSPFFGWFPTLHSLLATQMHRIHEDKSHGTACFHAACQVYSSYQSNELRCWPLSASLICNESHEYLKC